MGKVSYYYLLTIACFLSGLLSCSSDEGDAILYNHDEKKTSTELYEVLELSYQSKIQQLNFNQFFSSWNKNIASNSAETSDAREVYNVFSAFYDPTQLLKYGLVEWGNSLNQGARYLVIQNDISYSKTSDFAKVVNAYSSGLMHIKIQDFRPPVNIDAKKVLYLTPEYSVALNSFLRSEFTEPGEGGIMNPAKPSGESETRYKLLRNYIPVLHGHWGGYWHLESHPEVSEIIFDEKMEKARVFFRIGYEGGEALREKDKGQWVMKKSELTWIE